MRVAAQEDGDPGSWSALALRFFGGLALLFAVVLGVGHFFADEARELARQFVDELGVWGFALGTLLADGLHFPVPPQFYMLVGISAKTSPALLMLGIGAGSVVGGAVAFYGAQLASGLSWAERAMRRLSSSLPFRLRDRHPYRFVVVSSATPVPFAWLCYAMGFSGFSLRAYLLLALLRLPKLFVYYAIVRAGWLSVGGH